MVIPHCIVYTDSSKSYNFLDIADFKHFRINHSLLFVDRHNHINGFEKFWNHAKRHMRKFNGIPRSHFGLFTKECEWRISNPDPFNQLMMSKW